VREGRQENGAKPRYDRGERKAMMEKEEKSKTNGLFTSDEKIQYLGFGKGDSRRYAMTTCA